MGTASPEIDEDEAPGKTAVDKPDAPTRSLARAVSPIHDLLVQPNPEPPRRPHPPHRDHNRSRWRRLDAGRQALLVLAYLRNGDTYTRLAAGFEVGVATG
ncbi:hypothetical protein GCM10010166_56310 [Couchioplanes caeruleus subsp. azureus]|nr:hypothetical protein GCM10010166_56310 [Couchioplanes caeruleus subsp. azureus]